MRLADQEAEDGPGWGGAPSLGRQTARGLPPRNRLRVPRCQNGPDGRKPAPSDARVVQRAGDLRERGAGIAEIGEALGISRRSTFRALAQARPTPAGPLTEAELVALLEGAARKATSAPSNCCYGARGSASGSAPPARRSLIDELAARRRTYR